jgi:calcineurin-like phosphoesterase family protein
MNEAIVTNWNGMASPRDHIYHLGDVGWGSATVLRSLLDRLNGKIFLIKGNHDNSATNTKCRDRFEWIKNAYLFHHRLNGVKHGIFLSHYAHRSWYKSHHGYWHLYGHSHGTMPPLFCSFDVGVDCHNFQLLPLELVESEMALLQEKHDKEFVQMRGFCPSCGRKKDE